MQTSNDISKVEVLLATYNGARYLREQIDSILGQDYANLVVLAWDDGSTDGTQAILEEYAMRFPGRVQVCAGGEATGHPKLNFLRLMQASTAEYVCFADQDDVWLPHKVSLTMAAMRRMETRYGAQAPLLVFTDLRVVDERLQTLHRSFWQRAGLRAENIHRLERVLGDNVVTGCTAMMNRSLCTLATQMPAEAEMHDRWVGLLAAALGAAEPIAEQTVLYRQHGRNVVGSKQADASLSGLVSRSQHDDGRRAERLKSEHQVRALLRLHGAQLSPERRSVLEAYLRSGESDSAWSRVGITLRYGFYRSGLLRSGATIVDLWRARSTD